MNIDRIAREMVDVEPSVDLEARILARLDDARPAPVTRWWMWRVAVPATVAACAALAVVFQFPKSPSIEVVTAPVPQVHNSPIPQLPTLSGAELPKPRAPQMVRSQVRQAAAPELSAEEIAWMERRMPPLDPVTGLQMEQLQLGSIQPEPLAITPLTMTPVGTEGAGTERRIDR